MEYVGSFLLISTVVVVALAGVQELITLLTKRKLSFDGQHVLITGGSKGLGKSIAKHVFKNGGNVSIIARDSTALEQAKQELEAVRKSPSQKVITIQGDVCDQQAITTAIEKAKNALGVPKFVFSTAGSCHPGYFLELEPSVFQRQIELNYLGGVYVSHAVAKMMVANNVRGDIILVSSVAGFVSYVGFGAYSPTKFALRAFADALRNELSPHSINISIFYPPTMDTEGLAAENKLKPDVAVKIEGTIELVTADQAAQMLFAGLERKEYAITAEILGYATRVIGGGVSIRNNIFLEVFVAPLLTIVSSAMVFYFDWLASADYTVNKSRWIGNTNQKKQN